MKTLKLEDVFAEGFISLGETQGDFNILYKDDRVLYYNTHNGEWYQLRNERRIVWKPKKNTQTK